MAVKSFIPKFIRTENYGSIHPPFFGAQLVQGNHYFSGALGEEYLFTMDEEGNRFKFGDENTKAGEGIEVVPPPRMITGNQEVMPEFENDAARALFLKTELAKLGITVTEEKPMQAKPAPVSVPQAGGPLAPSQAPEPPESEDSEGQENGMRQPGPLTNGPIGLDLVAWAKGEITATFPKVRKEAGKIDGIDTTSFATIKQGLVEAGLVRADQIAD